jgi:hypothetical protein
MTTQFFAGVKLLALIIVLLLYRSNGFSLEKRPGIQPDSPQKALNLYIEATNSHVFTNVEMILSPNVVFWFQGEEYRGIGQARIYFEGAWTKLPDEKYEIKNVVWIHNGTESATCLFNYFYSGTFNGKPFTGKGKGTNVFVKDQGAWKLAHEHLTPLR